VILCSGRICATRDVRGTPAGFQIGIRLRESDAEKGNLTSEEDSDTNLPLVRLNLAA
jgi:hypothetical protein